MLNVEALLSCVPQLAEKDRAFALSLAAQWQRKGSLSERQMPYVGKLIERAANPQSTETTTETIGDLAGVTELFRRARAHLKFPKIALQCEGRDIRLSMAGARARVPGSINVVDKDAGTWFGRIQSEGTFEHSRRDPPPAALGALLKRFACDPAGVAAEHGRLHGRCCFCNTALRDERSTAVGYGPDCAEHYGLPWGSRPATFAAAVAA